MKEIKSKKARPGKRVIGKDDVESRKTTYNCDCTCFGTDSDMDGGHDLAVDEETPHCGCSCGTNVDTDNTLDTALNS